jgi:acetyl esterase/lipase
VVEPRPWDADRFVPVGQSRRLADALRTAGVQVEFTEIPGGDHMWMGVPQPGNVFDDAVGFARRVTADNTTL